jgi:predicted glycosyltransferase
LLELPILSLEDFQEADCKHAFGIVQASLEQDAEPAIDYIEQHLPDIFDTQDLPKGLKDELGPSQGKTFFEQFRSVLRLRKNIVEDRIQDIQFIQADEEARRYSKEEADKLYLELLTMRRVIDQALASPFLPEDQINKSQKTQKNRPRN